MKGKRLWWATLSHYSPRYAEWRQILGSDEVPLRDSAERAIRLGEEETRGYLIGLEQLSMDQFARLIEHLADKFSAPPLDVIAELKSNGHMPIRAEDVTIAFSLKAVI